MSLNEDYVCQLEARIKALEESHRREHARAEAWCQAVVQLARDIGLWDVDDPVEGADPKVWQAIVAAAKNQKPLADKVRALEAQLATSQANEAVCHCGSLVTEHTQSDNHGPVEREYPCQFAVLLQDAPCTCPDFVDDGGWAFPSHDEGNPECYRNRAIQLLATRQ